MDVTWVLIGPLGSDELMANVFDMCNPILRYAGCWARCTSVGLVWLWLDIYGSRVLDRDIRKAIRAAGQQPHGNTMTEGP